MKPSKSTVVIIWPFGLAEGKSVNKNKKKNCSNFKSSTYEQSQGNTERKTMYA